MRLAALATAFLLSTTGPAAAVVVADSPPDSSRVDGGTSATIDNWSDPVGITQTPVVIQPEKAVEFPGSNDIHSVAFSPDGEILYIAIDAQSIDLWKAAVSAWKEIFGVAAGLIALITVLVILRVRAKAQTPGHPHCRKCNYDVLGQAPKAICRGRERQRPAPGTLCPECGVDLHRRPPRRGRSAARRLAIPVTVGLAFVLTYGVMLAIGLPPTGRASTWFTLFSERIDGWAERNQIDRLLDFKMPVTRIVKMRTEDRSIVGTLASRRGRTATNMLVSPNGDRLVTAEGASRIVCLSTRWGWAVRSLADVKLAPWYQEPGIIRYDESGDVFVASFGATGDRSELCRWNVERGTRDVLISEPPYRFTAQGGQSVPELRRYAVIPTEKGLLFLSAPDFMQAYQEHRYPIVVHDGRGQIVREIVLPSVASPTAQPLVAGSSGIGFIPAGTSGLLGVDLLHGELLGAARPGERDVLQDQMACDRDGRLVFVSGFRMIVVRDTRQRGWIARLPWLEPYIAPTLTFSPDGRWLASVPFRSVSRQAGPYIHAVVLYDLKPLQDYLAEHPVTENAAPQVPPSMSPSP